MNARLEKLLRADSGEFFLKALDLILLKVCKSSIGNYSGTQLWVIRYDGPVNGSDAANAITVHLFRIQDFPSTRNFSKNFSHNVLQST